MGTDSLPSLMQTQNIKLELRLNGKKFTDFEGNVAVVADQTLKLISRQQMAANSDVDYEIVMTEPPEFRKLTADEKQILSKKCAAQALLGVAFLVNYLGLAEYAELGIEEKRTPRD